MKKIASSEITPENVYLSRRRFLKGGLTAVGSAALLAACGGSLPGATSTVAATPEANGTLHDELTYRATTFEDITNFNNFYEFTTDKTDVARLSKNFVTSPWQVTIGGLVNKPGIYDIEDIRTKFDQEERIYRMRCVEGWSMVIPWMGFPLRKLLDLVEPNSSAKYVRFESILDTAQLPGQKDSFFEWPYVEGLRLDEAYNDLTTLATGLYGQPLLPQNGAPVRLVVPWKYGFKSIKSIVKIDLVEEQPVSFWTKTAPNEYGFYSNVNPKVAHPRWSQASERRIGQIGRLDTLPFNGYQTQVEKLYEGLDLKINY